MTRSSLPGVFCKTGVLRNFAKLLGVFLWILLNSMNTFFHRTPLVATSVWHFVIMSFAMNHSVVHYFNPFKIKRHWIDKHSGKHQISLITSRSSHPEMFCEKVVLRNFEMFTGKHLCESLLQAWHLFLKNTSGGCFGISALSEDSVLEENPLLKENLPKLLLIEYPKRRIFCFLLCFIFVVCFCFFHVLKNKV